MTPLIIDTDPGIDDAFAIALAAGSPEVDLLAVTTVFGNVALSHTTANALRLLELCGRSDVPVAAGAERPLVHPTIHRASTVHGDDGLSGAADTLPTATHDVDGRHAVELMADLLRQATEPVTIAPIGPLTNVALLLALHPELKPKIGRIVAMGGGAKGGNTTAAAEFNIWSDPEAAHRVLAEEDVPTVLVPLDLTHRCAVDAAWLDRLAAGGRVAQGLNALTPFYRATYRRILGVDGMVLHDAIALAEAISPGILRTTPYPVEVDCSHGPSRGATIIDRRATAHSTRRLVDVALDADTAQLGEFVLSRIVDQGR
ncbi:nucleoside hydrolase [Kutzneria sp. NPDC051319]|uniref:nucleoside hydrolase n=1 Tax=Kutzneria sp. NPDC051319 TaxID=3155047 RepID=UPI0034408A1E